MKFVKCHSFPLLGKKCLFGRSGSPFVRLINLANIKEIPVEKERGRESGAIISGNDRSRPHNFSGDLEKSPIIPIYFRFVPNGFLGALFLTLI